MKKLLIILPFLFFCYLPQIVLAKGMCVCTENLSQGKLPPHPVNFIEDCNELEKSINTEPCYYTEAACKYAICTFKEIASYTKDCFCDFCTPTTNGADCVPDSFVQHNSTREKCDALQIKNTEELRKNVSWQCDFQGDASSSSSEKVIAPSLPLPNPLNSGGKSINSFQMLLGIIGKAVFLVMGAVVFFLFVINGIRLIISAGNAEKIKAVRETFVWSIIGLAVIIGSYFALSKLFIFLTGF